MSSDDSISFNGEEYDPEVVSAGIGLMRQSAASNARGIQPTASSGLGGADVSGDATIERWVGSQYNGDRDIQTVLGYPDLDDNTSLEQYRAKYEYQDIASRIVDAFPEETWRNAPEVVDVEGEEKTDFEQQANDLIDTRLNGYWRRLDRAQRLGEYGLMVIGFADGQDLSEPVQASALSSPDDIAYFNIFPQEQVENWELGKDSDRFDVQPTDERYNKPVEYLVDFSDIDADTNDDDFEQVHWSRVIHVAEGALETDLKGEPALKKVFYRLEDRMKVIGASAEMFWSGADEKIIANAKEDFALQQYDDSGKREDFKEQLNALIHDMQKYMVSSGMEFEVIGGQEVDPTGVIDAIDTSIATAVGMPKNKLRGNETGERATTQDRNNWFDTISSRQTNLGAPQFVRQTLDRLLTFGVLPDPTESDYAVNFPSLFEESDSDEAETQNQRASMLQASGLAMTLSSEQKLTFLQEGPGAVDMDTETRELPVDESDPDVRRGFNQLFEQVALTPPESVQDHAQDVLDWRDDPDKNVSGMTDTGWRRAEQLASGDELSPSDVQEIAAWFARHGADEYELNEDGMDPWRDNGRVAIKGWGGPPMRDWIEAKRAALVDAGDLEPVNNASRYGEGDEVSTPDGVGVVVDVLTETVEGDDQTVEASSDSPTYAVAVEDEDVGIGFYKASDLNAEEIDADVPSGVSEGESTENAIFNALGFTKNNFRPPESWRESTTPARVIALKALSGMGGSFDGCVREMRGNVRSPDRFCGSFLDYALGNPYWRGDSPLPGD